LKKEKNKNSLARVQNQINSLLNKEDIFTKLTTRSLNDTKLFNVFDEQKLEKIGEHIPEINRATKTLGRSKTNITGRLMTLTMLHGMSCPYRLLRQCLTEIEDRRGALLHNILGLKKAKIELETLQEKYQEMLKSDYDKKELAKLSLEIEEKATGISDSFTYIEGAIKDLANFVTAYTEIKKAHNIPDNWDEKDAQEEEIKFHIRRAFELLYRDILTQGRPRDSIIEYLSQFGINVQTALFLVKNYVMHTEQEIQQGKFPNIEHFEEFLDKITNEFQNEYKLVLKRMGLEDIGKDWYIYLDRNALPEE
jgi:hypothetical protein